MENNNGRDFEDPDFFNNVKDNIEKELSDLKKIVNKISQMRVEAAYLESDLMMLISASAWLDVAEFIGLTTTSIMDVHVKKENE